MISGKRVLAAAGLVALLFAPAALASIPSAADLALAPPALPELAPASIRATPEPESCGPFCQRLEVRLEAGLFGGGEPSVVALDAWGNYRNPAELEASKNRFGFTGHLFDRETGTYYAKARYFDPGLGRFLSQDSYLGEIDNPPSIHRYAWAHNRPTYYVDPSGNIAVLSDFQKRIDGLRQDVVDVGTDFAEYAGRNQALRMLGLDRRIAEDTGRLAGLFGAAGDAVGATNFAVNLGVLRFAESTSLGQEAAVELGESISAVEQTWKVVSTDPLGVAGRALNSVQETTEAAMRGDYRAIAEVNEQAARIAVELALGSKGTTAAVRGTREAAESAAKRLRAGSRAPVAPTSAAVETGFVKVGTGQQTWTAANGKVFTDQATYIRYMRHRHASMVGSARGRAAHLDQEIRAAGFEPSNVKLTEGPRNFVPEAMEDLFGNPHHFELKTGGYYSRSFENNIYPSAIYAGRRGIPFTLELRGGATISHPLRRFLLQLQKRFGGEIRE